MLVFDADGSATQCLETDRGGRVQFDAPPVSGKVIVNGTEHYHGRLEGEIDIALWSTFEPGHAAVGAPRPGTGGDTSYPGMQTRGLMVDGRLVLTDSEGYLVCLDDWSEAFVRIEAAADGLALHSEHWEVIRFMRKYYEQHGVQASVRDMVKHFRNVWGSTKGTSRYLHELFPHGGPQKQGNRLAGLLRTKGEH